MRAGNGLYGCDILCAQEIIPLRRMTRLPGAPEYVRGTLVTVVEGWKALGQPEPAERTEGGTTVLLQIGGGQKTIGFTVDEVVDMLAVAEETLEPRQALPGLDPKLVRAVGRRRDQLFVVLDTDALLGPVMTT